MTRVLVVEDEWLIADQMRMLLEEMGHEVVGPVSCVDDALRLIGSAKPDVALLDVSLGQEKSFPIAHTLAERGVPFLFVTGYLDKDLPAPFGAAMLLGKPVSESDLRTALQQLVG